MQNINVWQRGTSGAIGGLIGIFISRQFSNDWLWTSVRLIIGLLVGWMVAMFADNPRGFVQAIKDAGVEAIEGVVGIDYKEGWERLLSGVLAAAYILVVTLTACSIGPAFLLTLPSKYPINWGNLFWISSFFAVCLPLAALITVVKIQNSDKRNDAVWIFRVMAMYANPVGILRLLLLAVVAVWTNRANIRRAVNAFFASILLYFIENAGLAIMTNVLLALGAGHLYGYVAGVSVGFISGVTGAVIYNKGQVRLRMIVAERNL